MIRILWFLFLIGAVYGEAQKTVGIFCPGECATPWDPDSIQRGITGSEEAVIYMSQRLKELGFKVCVFAQPPENSPYRQADANPRFVDLNFQDGTPLDIAIAWRYPQVGPILKTRAKKVFLWPHDTWYDRLSEEAIGGFDGVLWLSDWQRRQWSTANPPFSKFNSIFGNGINPSQFKEVETRKNPYACIYASNYARGLEHLLTIWPMVKNCFPQATLDIYYGWQSWGLLSPKKEAAMRAKVASLASLGVTEHGLVGHEELNRAFEKASFWTYPCTAEETFCITALRAQCAGAVPVIIQGSALKETVRHGYQCKNVDEYLFTLINAMRNSEQIQLEERKKMREFVLNEYTWMKIAVKWKEAID